MHQSPLLKSILLLGVILIASTLAVSWSHLTQASAQTNNPDSPGLVEEYALLAWNDLGMHCYNRDFQDLAVLPPFNTLWAQVIRVGDPPQVITDGITVEYSFPDNTYSVGKSNFWTYDVDLFGVDLPDNVGLKGFGLSGQMTVTVDHFEAIGIPLTEFRDSAPTTPYPYQLATIIAKETASGNELARLRVVAPVSTEMHCDFCHYDGAIEGISTGRVETNILTLHDEENQEDYPSGHEGPLMSRRPILCAECHASNALGAPGVAGLPSLSKAMHEQHDGIVPDSITGCYNCHPGPQTHCLRDVMSSSAYQIYCVDCHGTMYHVSQNPNPWLNEPRCDNVACHGSSYALDQPLYRMSKDHGEVYCEGCHDSPHAIAPSSQMNDWLKFLDLQRHAGPLDDCLVCHASLPASTGPHGLSPIMYSYIYMPLIIR
jgi:hypothetical protein